MIRKTELSPVECAGKIKNANHLVVLTGAGISTKAGIPDFRGPNGLYNSGKYDPDKIFNIKNFLREPKPFFDFSREFLELLEHLRPTFTHRFLAELERSGTQMTVITQNIDMLHQQAGSRNVIELHGSYAGAYCMETGAEYDAGKLRRLICENDVPRSPAGGIIKPDVVFFGEPVRMLHEAARVSEECDLMLVLGSSLTVFPAAGLPDIAGGEVIVVDTGMVRFVPGQGRYLVDEELDDYSRCVADELGLEVADD